MFLHEPDLKNVILFTWVYDLVIAAIKRLFDPLNMCILFLHIPKCSIMHIATAMHFACIDNNSECFHDQMKLLF